MAKDPKILERTAEQKKNSFLDMPQAKPAMQKLSTQKRQRSLEISKQIKIFVKIRKVVIFPLP